MKWKVNQYYPLSEAHDEAMSVASGLLYAYPLTGACLEILGENLLNKLEFGFFSTGSDIIRQGEPGKSFFLLCRGWVDVMFNGQLVVTMEAPTLLGDKAIVEPNSTRAATIRVSKGEDALFIKIPMGLFIRDFSNKSLPDQEFDQEVRIFCNVFSGIQQRLFNYIYLQKQLWEEVNTTLDLLNSQLIAKSLDNKKEMDWGDRPWGVIKKYLANHLKFAWPDKIPLNSTTFRDFLYQLSEKKFPRKAFKGNDNEYLINKHLLVRKWLMQISEEVTKVLTPEQLPFYMGDIELFNPRNYHMRMSKLFRSAEKKFPVKKAQTISIVEKTIEVPAISSFFGKGERANEFELERYLTSFGNNFSIKFPKRILAQLGQRSALITAECENLFNTSVARMQTFLEKAKSKSITPPPIASTEDINEQLSRQLRKSTETLLKGFVAYNRHAHMITDQQLGETSYSEGFVPVIDELVKSSATRTNRTELEQAFQQIQEAYLNGNRNNKIPVRFIKRNLFLCESSPDDIVPFKELKQHFWMPISEGIVLMNEEEVLAEVKPGTLLGGKGWDKGARSEEQENQYYLKMPSRQGLKRKDQTFLLFVIPSTELSWEKESDITSEKYLKEQLPAMQWLLDKHAETLVLLLKERDQNFQQWFEILQIINLEKKMSEFENNHTLLAGKQFQIVEHLLNTTVGLKLEDQSKVYSDQLTKKIYNHILRKMGEVHPNMPVEERSNKTYTKWRFILSEVIKGLQKFESETQDTGIYNPTPVYEIISNELDYLATTYLGEKKTQYTQFSEENYFLDFTSMMKESEEINFSKKLTVFRLMIKTIENHVHILFQEVHEGRLRLEKIQDQRPQTGTDDVKLEIIKDGIEKLTQILKSTS